MALRKPPRVIVHETLFFAAGTGFVAAVSLIHFIARPEMSFSIFYLVPIALVTWFASSNQGLAIAAISAAAWMIAERISAPTSLNGAILFWNAVVR